MLTTGLRNYLVIKASATRANFKACNLRNLSLTLKIPAAVPWELRCLQSTINLLLIQKTMIIVKQHYSIIYKNYNKHSLRTRNHRHTTKTNTVNTNCNDFVQFGSLSLHETCCESHSTGRFPKLIQILDQSRSDLKVRFTEHCRTPGKHKRSASLAGLLK